jgi:pimeloyl-ACP methyl ester carboxylesterase
MKSPRVGVFSLLFLCVFGAAEADEKHRVVVEQDTRITRTGDRISYLLLVPTGASGTSVAPYPAVLLTHGFARDYGRHIDHALHLARRGVIVMVPNLIDSDRPLFVGRRQVENTADHVRWLIARAGDSSDPLFGVLDSSRIALAGHSAGGAVSLEAVVKLQESGIEPDALVLLDAVPYPRTLRMTHRLAPLPLLSLESDPSSCNASGAIGALGSYLDFGFESRLIAGATHCDPESPTDIACELACGGTSEPARIAYRDQMTAFLLSALGVQH